MRYMLGISLCFVCMCVRARAPKPTCKRYARAAGCERRRVVKTRRRPAQTQRHNDTAVAYAFRRVRAHVPCPCSVRSRPSTGSVRFFVAAGVLRSCAYFPCPWCLRGRTQHARTHIPSGSRVSRSWIDFIFIRLVRAGPALLLRVCVCISLAHMCTCATTVRNIASNTQQPSSSANAPNISRFSVSVCCWLLPYECLLNAWHDEYMTLLPHVHVSVCSTTTSHTPPHAEDVCLQARALRCSCYY